MAWRSHFTEKLYSWGNHFAWNNYILQPNLLERNYSTKWEITDLWCYMLKNEVVKPSRLGETSFAIERPGCHHLNQMVTLCIHITNKGTSQRLTPPEKRQKEQSVMSEIFLQKMHLLNLIVRKPPTNSHWQMLGKIIGLQSSKISSSRMLRKDGKSTTPWTWTGFFFFCYEGH